MNALAVMDGSAAPSRELTQSIKSVGAQAFHRSWVAAMTAAGWRCGGNATNHATLMTPHMRRWSLLVDGQRKPLIAAGEVEVVATWEGDDE